MNDHIAPRPDEAGADAGAGGPGLIRGLLAAIMDSFKTRVDLAAVEAEIYLVYVAQLLLWGFAAVACALLAVVFALTGVIIAVWQTHRMAGLVGAMVTLLILAAICGFIGARRVNCESCAVGLSSASR